MGRRWTAVLIHEFEYCATRLHDHPALTITLNQRVRSEESRYVAACIGRGLPWFEGGAAVEGRAIIIAGGLGTSGAVDIRLSPHRTALYGRCSYARAEPIVLTVLNSARSLFRLSPLT